MHPQSEIPRSEKWRHIIAQAWAGMLCLLLLMMLTDLTEAGMQGDFSGLAKDPGTGGLWFIVIVAAVNVLFQVCVRAFASAAFRWAAFSASSLYTLIFLGHQATHMLMGEGFDMHAILDLTHHALGIWASIAAYRWATAKEAIPVS